MWRVQSKILKILIMYYLQVSVAVTLTSDSKLEIEYFTNQTTCILK